jgi:hypothetical protein
MWANSVWGFFTLGIGFGLAMLTLSPEQGWLRPWLLWTMLGCFAVSALVLLWPLQYEENRTQVRIALQHPLKWAAENIGSKQLIVVGLTGVILFAAIALAGVIWQGRSPVVKSYTTATLTQEQPAAQTQQAPSAVPAIPILIPEDVSNLLRALGQMQSIINDQVRPAYEATQNISLSRLLATGGASAVIAKLQPIRDSMRQARKDFGRLLFDYRYYDAQLRPAIAGYEFPLDWMDGSLTSIIDDLNKYSSTSADVLEALVRDRFVEWSNGIGAHFTNWYGGVEFRIATETKTIREWPRIIGSLQQPTFTPGIGTPPDPKRETIQWNEVFGTSRSIDLVFALFLDGTGPADHSVKLKDAYIESASEGDQIHASGYYR